jgi:RNA polymerase sigma-70 factor (ECF subfamily)
MTAAMTTADPLPPAARGPAFDWEAALRQHEGWLRRVIAARTGEPAASDEVWQQVVLAAVEQRWPLTDPAKVGPWLHRLAVIAAARYRRQAGRHRRAVAGLAGRQQANGHTADPLRLLMRRERLDLTRQALARLPPRDAEMLLLKYGERWSYRQIAEHLGITDRAVDSRLLRAREALRQQLATLGIEGDEP